MIHTHRHRAKSSEDRAFSGPVADPENRAAHGNICSVDTCSCGATRSANVNGRHVEQGKWVEPTDWNATPNASRKRPMVTLTMSDAGLAQLDRLAAKRDEPRGRVVEAALDALERS